MKLDFKTAPSLARSPKIGVFERVLTRGREMGERGEKESRGQGKKEMGREVPTKIRTISERFRRLI